MKFLKKNIKLIIEIILVMLLVSGISVYASYKYLATDVSYTKDGTEISVENALNELYNKLSGETDSNIIGATWNYSYTGNYQTFVVPYSGTYKIELWGAQGYSGSWASGGKGSYVSGEVNLNYGTKLAVYVGSSGNNGGYNGGGGNATYPGGGATDIRYDYDENNEYTLQERLIVAAGGSGGYNYSSRWYRVGTYGGTLNGINGAVTNGSVPTGGTQTSGGIGNNSKTDYSGGFGYGGNGAGTSVNSSGGGGGYYGGGGTYNIGSSTEVGGSGSCFISGYDGCDAIDENGEHTGKSIHYSGISFINGTMIAGNATMPSTEKGLTTTGRSGNGYVRITLIE